MNHYKCYLKQLIFKLSELPNNCTGMAIFQPIFHQGTLLFRKGTNINSCQEFTYNAQKHSDILVSMFIVLDSGQYNNLEVLRMCSFVIFNFKILFFINKNPSNFPFITTAHQNFFKLDQGHNKIHFFIITEGRLLVSKYNPSLIIIIE